METHAQNYNIVTSPHDVQNASADFEVVADLLPVECWSLQSVSHASSNTRAVGSTAAKLAKKVKQKLRKRTTL